MSTLFKGPCRELHATLARNGEVFVDQEEIRFTPSALDRVTGAREWLVAIPELSGVVWEEKERLSLTDGIEQHVIGGPRVPEIFLAIRKALDSYPTLRAAPPALADGETILHESEVRVVYPSTAKRPALLTITTARVCLTHGGHHRLEAGAVGLDVPNEDLADARLGAGAVTLVTPAGNHQLVSSDAPSVFLALCGLDEKRDLVVSRYRRRDAKRLVGRNVSEGVLALTREHLRFAGASPDESLELPYEQIKSFKLGQSQRLQLDTEAGPAAFELADVEAAFEELQLLVASSPWPASAQVGATTADATAALLEPWKDKLPAIQPELASATLAVLMVNDRNEANRGAVVMFHEGIILVSLHGSGHEQDPVLLANDDFVLHDLVPSSVPSLSIKSVSISQLRLVPHGGGESVAQLHARLATLCRPEKDQDAAAKDGRRSFRTVPAIRVVVQVHGVRDARGVAIAAPASCDLVNISPEGCRLQSDEPMPNARTIDLSLPSSQTPIRVRAEIVNRTEPRVFKGRGWQFGLSFARADAPTKRRLADLAMDFQRQSLQRMRELK